MKSSSRGAARFGKRVIGAATVAALVLGSATATAAPQLLVINGKVFTADETQSFAQAVAVEDGLVLAVGTDERIRSLAGPNTRVIDVGGRLVTPGFVEAHIHLAQDLPTRPTAMPNLPFPGPTGEEAIAAIQKAVQLGGSEWICAYIGPLVARDPRNWRAALDAVAPNTPVFLRGFWGHTSIVNSEGLRRLGIAEDVADPLGGWWGRDANGRLDGRAYEGAEIIGPLIRPAEPERLAKAYEEAAQRYARWGVTSIHLMNSDKSLPATLAALAIVKPRQKWTVYSWGAWETPPDHIETAWTKIEAVRDRTPHNVRVEGPKWVLDGSPIEQYSFQRVAYEGRPGWFGRSDYSDAQLREILRLALERPSQPALHAVGDAETDRLLKMMEQLAPAAAWRARRVRIEHGDGLRDDTMKRAAQMGLIVIQYPTHFHLPPADGTRPLMDRTLPLKSLLAAGIGLALGSDGGAREQNPFLNVMLAISYPDAPGEALTREEALRAYTAGGAYAEGQERRKGRLAPGLAADLAVLSQDILVIPASQLPATTSLLTLADGVVIFEDAALTSPK